MGLWLIRIKTGFVFIRNKSDWFRNRFLNGSHWFGINSQSETFSRVLDYSARLVPDQFPIINFILGWFCRFPTWPGSVTNQPGRFPPSSRPCNTSDFFRNFVKLKDRISELLLQKLLDLLFNTYSKKKRIFYRKKS